MNIPLMLLSGAHSKDISERHEVPASGVLGTLSQSHSLRRFSSRSVRVYKVEMGTMKTFMRNVFVLPMLENELIVF